MYSFIKSLQSYFRGVGGCRCFCLDTTNEQDVDWGSGCGVEVFLVGDNLWPSARLWWYFLKVGV